MAILLPIKLQLRWIQNWKKNTEKCIKKLYAKLVPVPARPTLCPDGESYFVFVPFSGTLGIQETLLKSMLEIFASMRRSLL